MASNLADIITCAKFQDDIFMRYDFTEGRISHFPIDFCMGLTTVQRYCAVLIFDLKCTTCTDILPSLNLILHHFGNLNIR